MDKNQKDSGVEEYVLREGHRHHGFDEDGNRKVFFGGDKVLLNPRQYKAFADKFESTRDQKARVKAQNEMQDLRTREAKIRAALQKKGISLDDLLEEETAKKPDPQPSVGTAEPTPANVTPPPVGSTPDPTNQPPKPGSAAAAGSKK